MQRIIGKYVGQEKGPLLVITAGMHGNEPAGVKALDLLFKMLEVEPITNPDFSYKGEIIGILGNVQAYHQQKRFIDHDLNRSWHPSYVQQIRDKTIDQLQHEDLEIKEILDIIDTEFERVGADKIYLLDLHTTSSEGGIFCITTHEKESIRIAHDIHAPVVLGLLDGIDGTTLHYFSKENLGVPTTAIAFEGGHHDDPLSVNRCIAATINFMRAIGVIKAEHVANHHDKILLEYAQSLPEVVEVHYKFHIEDNHGWQMKPGYQNFQPIYHGEVLATYEGKDVVAPMDGLILMPLYQTQGQDGFFIVQLQEVW
jgi:succinylglutamate desuccinylase